LLYQQVDQGLIADDVSDFSAVSIFSGVGTEDYGFVDISTGVGTTSGSGTDSWSGPITYDDTISGSITASALPDYAGLILATPGLKSYWRLSDTSGAAVDEKGVANGTYVGSVTRDVLGLLGNDTDKAADFPGTTGNYIDLGNPLPAGPQLTVEAWVKFTTTQTNAQFFSRSTLGNVWTLGFDGFSRWSWFIRAAGTIDTTIIDNVAPVPGVHHVVATFTNGGVVALYLDGVLVDSKPAPSGNPSGSNAIYIGAKSSTSEPFTGTMDEAALYDVALDVTQVFAHYRAGLAPERFTYTDSRTGTVGVSGTSTESEVFTDTRTGTGAISGTGFETITPYDAVLDVDNPISHWKLGESTSGALDRKRRNNLNATNGPITSVAGLLANNSGDPASTFVSASSQLLSSSFTGIPYDTTTWSAEAWIKPTTSGNFQYAVRRASVMELGYESSLFTLNIIDNGSVDHKIKPATPAVASGTTYHLVGTYDGTLLILYVNGVEIGRLSFSGIRSSAFNAPQLGNQLNGVVDEAAWYNTVLSSDRVLAHYLAGLPVFTYTDTGTGTITTSGKGFETITPYDAVLDVDNPVSHWKLGDPNTAVDRKQTLNLSVVSGSIATIAGIVANNGSSLANTFARVSGQKFYSNSGLGQPYESATWSLEAWVKPTTVTSSRVTIRSGRELRITALGGIQFWSRDAGGTARNAQTGNGFVVAGVPVHLVGVSDGTALRVYINGVQQVTLPCVGDLSTPTATPEISNEEDGVNGVIDEVAWYTTALSPARVLAHYLAGIPAVVYDDAQVGNVIAGGTGSESYGILYSDALIGNAIASGASTESWSGLDAFSGSIISSGTSTESWSGPIVYNDTASGSAIVRVAPDYSGLILATSGLVSYWRLSDTSGVAVDEKGVSNGTYTGSVTRDAVGLLNNDADTAAAFPGTVGNYVALGNALAVAPQLTVEVWVNFTTAPISATVFSRSVASLNWHLALDSSSRWVFYVRPSGGSDKVITSSASAVPGIHHVVGTYTNNGSVNLYIDGVSVGSQVAGAFDTLGNSSLILGARTASTEPFNGTLDEAAVYTAALDISQVLLHYRAGFAPDRFTHANSRTGSISVSGTGTEQRVFPDSSTGNLTASGSGVELYQVLFNDSVSGTIIAKGKGFEPTPYDFVIDADHPVSHWKLGTYTDQALDRVGPTDLITPYPMQIVPGLVLNNANGSASVDIDRNAELESLISGSPGSGIAYSTPTWSVEIWFNTASVYAGYLIDCWGLGQGINVSVTISAEMINSDGNYVSLSGTTVEVDTTYHVVSTYDGDDLILYVNGIEEGRLAVPDVWAGTGSLDYIPKIYPDAATVDEAAWYDHALSAARVLAHYQIGSEYMDTGSGTIVATGKGVESNTP